MTDQENKINWDEVESAEAQEDGLHVKKKDGTVGVVMTTKPVGQNLQRRAVCKDITDVLNNQSKSLNQLLETQAQVAADQNWSPSVKTQLQMQLNKLIAACKANIAEIQDLMRKVGCG